MSFSKALASDYPRGVNLVVETDFYYHMYSSISDLFPKDKKSAVTTTLNPATTTTSIPIKPVQWVENPKFDSFSGTYYDTSDFWRRKVRELSTIVFFVKISWTFVVSRIRIHIIITKNTFRSSRATSIGNHRIRIISRRTNLPKITVQNQFTIHQRRTWIIDIEIWIGDSENCIEVEEICTVTLKV